MSKLFWLLVASVLLSPLPFGSRQPWAWTVLGLIVALVLILWAARLVVSRDDPPVSASMVWPVLLPFALVAAWIAVQTSSLTPESWHHPLWRSAAEVLGEALPGAVSVDPHVTGDGLLRLLIYGAIFWLSLQFCRASQRAKQVFYGIAMAGLGYAAYGVIVEFTGSNTILWFDKVLYPGSVTGTIEYKNAYATYAGLGLISAMGLLLKVVDDAAADVSGPRERLRRVVSRVLGRGWILAVACIVIATALLLSNSRGGFLAAIAAIVALLLAVAMTQRRKSRYLKTVAGAVVVGCLGVVMVSGGTILDRLDRLNPERDTRTQLFELTTEAIADAPWLGTGQGTFAEIFPIYRTRDIPHPAYRAHNAYLDNALGLGLPAAAALVLAVAAMAGLCLLGVRRRRRNALYPCMGVAATVLIGVHALFDFTLQVPAVTATYCLLMGAGCGQSWSSLANRE